LIFIFFNTINLNFRFIADINLYKRPFSGKAVNIGLWENIFEFIILLSVALNTGLFYFATKNPFNQYYFIINKAANQEFETDFDYGNFEINLLTIIIIEHFFLASVIILKFFINPCPSWIIKENEYLLSMIEDAKRVKIEREIEQIDNALQREAINIEKEINEKDKSLLDLKHLNFEVNNEIEKLKEILYKQNEIIEAIIQKDNQYIEKIALNLFTNSHKDEENIKMSFEKRYKNGIKEKIKGIMVGEKILTDVDKEEEDLKISMQKLFVVSQFTKTFTRIEKEIVSKKMEKLIYNMAEPLIICSFCNNLTAVFICQKCKNDVFCNVCFDEHKEPFEKRKEPYYDQDSKLMNQEHIGIPIVFPKYERKTILSYDKSSFETISLIPLINKNSSQYFKGGETINPNKLNNEKDTNDGVNPLM
jgi:hypothetical protein